MVVRGSAWRGGDLGVGLPGVEHGGHVGVTQHVRVHPCDPRAAAAAAFGEHCADVVLDNVGGTLRETALPLTALGEGFPRTAHPTGVSVTGIKAAQLAPHDRSDYLEQALPEAAGGVIAPVIGQASPLEQAAAAHAAIEDRHVFGKTLIATGIQASRAHAIRMGGPR